MNFVKKIFESFRAFESDVNLKTRFTNFEIMEIKQNSKSENLEYFWDLAKIVELTSFDISFLMQNVFLDEEKIKTIKKAVTLYNPEEFNQVGQTFSDFIFRILSNMDVINCENLEDFKEIISLKNEIYDLKKFVSNKKHIKLPEKGKKCPTRFAFERVLY